MRRSMSFPATTRMKKSPATLLAVLLTGALVSVLVPSANAATTSVAVKSKCTKSGELAVAKKTGATLKCDGKKWRGYKAATSVLAIASAAFSPKEEFAIFAVPKNLGYFKAENLTVSAVPSTGSIDVVNIVSAGRADVGVADLGSAMQGIEKGARIRIVGGLVQNFPWAMATNPAANIKSAADLKGKKIGIIGFGSGSYPYTKAWLAGNGLAESDVTLVATGSAIAPATEALMKGDVDAIAYYTAVYASSEFLGTKYSYLPNPAALTGVRSLSWIVNSAKYKEDPEVYERLIRAANKGLVYSSTNLKAAVLLGYQEFPALLAGATVESKVPAAMAGLKAWLASATPTTGKPASWSNLSNISAEDWKKSQDYTKAAGTIVSEIDLEVFLDRALVVRVNAYDRKAVVAAANKQPK